MKKEKTNPFNLVQSIKLINRNNPDMKLILKAQKLALSEHNTYVMDSYKASICDCKYSIEDRPVLESFMRVKKFCNMCNNKYEAISMIIDTYKKNKKLMRVKISVVPTLKDEKLISEIRDFLLA